MPEILIVTAHVITREEFSELVTSMDARLQDLGTYFIPNQDGYVHVNLSESEMNILIKEKVRLKLVTEKLGKVPKSVIVVSIGRTGEGESEQLALAFALKVARQWGAVVDNVQPDEDHHIYTLHELEEMEQREGRWSD